MSGYTKEPWNVSSGVIVVSGAKIVHNGVPVGLGTLDVDYDEAVANAHLISAAPEMYEALRGVLDFMEHCRDELKHRGETQLHRNIIEKALDKAEGKS